jgi:hypothetical protein
MARSRVRYGRYGQKIVTVYRRSRRRFRGYSRKKKMAVFGIPLTTILLVVGGYFVYTKFIKKAA